MKIIAVDFDGCIVADRYPDIGKAIPETINNLKAERRNNTKLILWTCRRDEQLAAAVEYCKSIGLEFDAVNENLPELIDQFGGDTRKIYVDEYWDDKAVKMPYMTEQKGAVTNE